MRKEFRSLLSLSKARSIVLGHIPVPELEEVPLECALGKILGERIVSEIDVPGFNRASMDGYAVLASDTVDAREDRPARLCIAGIVPMGQEPDVSLSAGEAIEVSTGSMMPPGADAVVMVENTESNGDYILVRGAVHAGENVLRAGSDITFGDLVLSAGTRITQREMGVLAAVGRSAVRVRALRVAVASTGDELVAPGMPLLPGKVYDINSYSIAAAAQECGATPVLYGILPDEREAVAEALIRMSEECAITIVSGSTSAGSGDMVYHILDQVGDLLFHGINFKPGKPTIYGLVQGTPFFGMPGYPTSALTVFGQIVAPVIAAALGTELRSKVFEGVLARPVRSEGRRQMMPVGISGALVYPADRGSGSITTLSQADGVMEIPEEVEYMGAGEKVEVELFGEFAPQKLMIMGENCPVLEAIVDLLPGRTRVVNSGLFKAVTYLEDGISDLVSISGRRDLPKSCVLIRGYKRDLGLVSRDPDLLELQSLEGKRVLGWSKDSEMSRIFGSILKGAGIESPVYAGMAKSHSAVAAAVASCRADLGFCSRAGADVAGVHFRKAAEDEVNFAARAVSLDAGDLNAFLKALKSFKFPEGTSPLENLGSALL